MPDTRSDRTRLLSRESNESRLALILPKLTSRLCRLISIGSFEDAVRRPENCSSKDGLFVWLLTGRRHDFYATVSPLPFRIFTGGAIITPVSFTWVVVQQGKRASFGETRRWRVARESSPESYAFKAEVPGPRNVADEVNFGVGTVSLV